MADSTKFVALKPFQWSTPSAPNPRLSAPVSSTATTLTFTSAPLDESGAVITEHFIMGAKDNNGYVENIYVPAGALSVDGLTATGVTRGVGLTGLDFNTEVAGNAVDLPQDAPVSCNVDAVTFQMMQVALQGTIASGGENWKIGNEADNDITVTAANGDANEPFWRFDASENEWVYSNDGVSTQPFGDGSGLAAGNGIDITGGSVSVDLNTSSKMSVDSNGLKEAALRDFTLNGTLTALDLFKIVDDSGVEIEKAVSTEVYADGSSVEIEDTITVAGTATLAIPGTNKFVEVYSDGTNIRYVITTVASDNTFTSTTPATVVAVNTNSRPALIWDPDTERIGLFYVDLTATDGKAIIGQLATDYSSITWGTAVTFEAGAVTYLDAVYDTTNNVAVVYFDDPGDGSKGKGSVGTITGGGTNSISFETPVQFEAGNADQISAAFGNGVSVVAYSDVTDSQKGKMVVGTVSGVTLTFGTEVQYQTKAVRTILSYDSAETAWLLVSLFNTTSSNLESYKITVSGTVPTASAVTVVQASSTASLSQTLSLSYGSAFGEHYLVIDNVADSDLSYWNIDISGSTPSVGTEQAIESTSSLKPSSAWSTSAGRLFVGYSAGSDGDMYGVVVQPAGDYVDYDTIAGVILESGVADDVKKGMLLGGIAGGFSGLTPGNTVIANSDATIGEGSDTATLIGRAISATEVNLTKNP